MKWKDIFPDDPDQVGQAEYRAIHDVVAEALFGTTEPDPRSVLSGPNLEFLKTMLEEFREWATVLAARTGQHYLLVIWGDVEPELLGPFHTETERDERARGIREQHGRDHGLYRVSLAPPIAPMITGYLGGFFEETDSGA